MGHNWNELGDWFKKERERRGISIKDAVELSGAGRTTIVQFEDGSHAPTTDIVAKLCYAYDLPEDIALELVYTMARKNPVEIKREEEWWVYRLRPILKNVPESAIRQGIAALKGVIDGWRDHESRSK